MAIKIRFDSANNAVQPTFVLTTRNGHKLGALIVHNLNVSESMNSYSEIAFNVYKEECRKTDGTVNTDLWNSITDLKLVYCKEFDTYYELAVDKTESDDIVKQISAVSLGEAELSQIGLHDIQINTEDDIAREDYTPTVLYDPDHPESSLLNRILSKAPHYTIAHVDEGLESIQRTFEFDNTTIYDAMQDIAEELSCFFDIVCSDGPSGILRKIYVYDLLSYCRDCGERGDFTTACDSCEGTDIRPGYGSDTGIFVNVENLADEITLTTDKDSIKNCFRLQAGDDYMTATVVNCNPNGSDYIWVIPEEMKADMSDALADRLDDYSELYDYYQNEYEIALDDEMRDAYNALVAKYHSKNPALTAIPELIIGYPAMMNVYYDVVDFYLYLAGNMFPEVVIPSTSAAQEVAKLTSASLSPVAVTNLDTCSLATATNSVLAMAKTIVNPLYQIKVSSSEYVGHVWTGKFTVTSYSDEDDTAESASNVSITITDNYETYIRQRIENALHDDSDEITDISELFALNDAAFQAVLKDYCLTKLNSFYDACSAVLNILVEQGIANNETWADKNPNMYETVYMPYYRKLGYIEAEIQVRESEIFTINGQYDVDGRLVEAGMRNVIEDERSEIQSELDFDTYLGTTLVRELAAYRREDVYQNDNYISDGLDNAEMFAKAKEFLNVAQKEIETAATPQHSITATLKNLLVMKEFSSLTSKFDVGNWIRIRIDGSIYKLRLLQFDIDYDNIGDLSVEFSDVRQRPDGISDVQSILKQAASMASSYAAVSSKSDQGASGNAQLTNWIQDGLSLTKMKIVDSASNQNITWDDHGFLCREFVVETNDYDPRQLKIINRGLYLTSDNWLTSRAGIGDFLIYNPETETYEQTYAVVADTVVSSIVLSEKVGIYTEGNTIKMDGDGITVTDDITTVTINPQSEEGVFVIDGNGQKAIWMDKDGNAHFRGYVAFGDGDEINSLDVGGRNLVLNSGSEHVSGTTPADYTYSDFSITDSGGDVVVTDMLTLVSDSDGNVVLESTSMDDIYVEADAELQLLYMSPVAWEYDLTSMLAALASSNKWIISLLAKTTGAGALSVSIHDNSGNLLLGTEVTELTEDYARYQFTLRPTDEQIAAAKKLRVNYSATSGVLYVKDVKMEYGDVATTWSPAPEDVEGEIDDVRANANAMEQIIYISKASGSTVTAPDEWIIATDASAYDPNTTYAVGECCVQNNKLYQCITAITTPETWTASHWEEKMSSLDTADADDISNNKAISVQNAWTTKRPKYKSAYPVLFVATQRQTVDGVITCTEPMIDDTTTVIDGGHITTGEIDANVVTVKNINASKINTGTLTSIAINNGSGTFSVDSAGNLIAASAVISGDFFTSSSGIAVKISNGAIAVGTYSNDTFTQTNSISYDTFGTMSGLTVGGSYFNLNNTTVILPRNNVIMGLGMDQDSLDGYIREMVCQGSSHRLGNIYCMGINASGTVSAPDFVKAGSGTADTLSGNWYYTDITFASAFSGAPKVTATPTGQPSGSEHSGTTVSLELPDLRVASVTASGFRVYSRVQNQTFDWVAVYTT